MLYTHVTSTVGVDDTGGPDWCSGGSRRRGYARGRNPEGRVCGGCGEWLRKRRASPCLLFRCCAHWVGSGCGCCTCPDRSRLLPARRSTLRTIGKLTQGREMAETSPRPSLLERSAGPKVTRRSSPVPPFSEWRDKLNLLNRFLSRMSGKRGSAPCKGERGGRGSFGL